MHTLKPGDRFFHYVVGRLLGQGFHGQVYELTHSITGDRFALKTMHLENVGDARKAQRALAEARGTYGIDHVNVIKVLDLNCEDSGLVWMRTELLLGESIAELLGRVGRFSPLFALSVAIEAAHGLHAAHEAQIIHRDVKPANLFYVSATHTVKVIDFSIAKVFPEGLQTTVGRAGMGTPAYMPPEQLEGAVPTPAFDGYALGISLWQMLAGRHPFHDVLHNPDELLRKQFAEMPPLLSEVIGMPGEVDRVVRRAVTKDPAERYPTMREMAQALTELRAWLQHEADVGRISLPVPPGEPPLPGDARSRRDYTPPTVTPHADQPAPETARRIVLADHLTRAMAPAGSRGGTLPLGSRGALAGTVPLTEPQTAAPPARAALRDSASRHPLAATAPSAPATPTQRSPDTPTGVENTAPTPTPSRVPWLAVLVAAAAVSLATILLFGWIHRRDDRERSASAALASASAPAPTPLSAQASATPPPGTVDAPPVKASATPPTPAAPTPVPSPAPSNGRTNAPRATGRSAAPATPSAAKSERPRASSRPFDIEN